MFYSNEKMLMHIYYIDNMWQYRIGVLYKQISIRYSITAVVNDLYL